MANVSLLTPGWMYGNLDGRVGIFPADYVEPMSRLEARNPKHRPSQHNHHVSPAYFSRYQSLVRLVDRHGTENALVHRSTARWRRRVVTVFFVARRFLREETAD